MLLEQMLDSYFKGLMSKEEEKNFKERMLSNEDLLTNALAHAFLFKAIQRIRMQDSEILESASRVRASDISTLFEDMRNEEDDGMIDMYLKDQIPDDKRSAFELRMASDMKFRERLAAVAMLNKGISEQRRKDSQVLDDAGKLTKKDIISVIWNERKIEDGAVAAAVPIWPKIRRVAAVVAVVVVAAGAFEHYNSGQMMGIAGQNMTYAMSGISAPTRAGISEDNKKVLDELELLFKSVESNDGISASTVVRLREYYDIATNDIVDFEDTYVDQISLAMATAYIYTGQKGRAKEILMEIVSNPDVSADAKSMAEKLLKKTKWSFVF